MLGFSQANELDKNIINKKQFSKEFIVLYSDRRISFCAFVRKLMGCYYTRHDWEDNFPTILSVYIKNECKINGSSFDFTEWNDYPLGVCVGLLGKFYHRLLP